MTLNLIVLIEISTKKTITKIIFCGFYYSRILCDTGESNKPDYIRHLKTVLKDEKATISDIILTHWHHDHIGGVKEVLQCLDDANGLFLSLLFIILCDS